MVPRGTGESDRPVQLSVGSGRDEPRLDPGGEVLAVSSPQRRWGRVVGAVAVLAVAFLVGWGVGYDRGYQTASGDAASGPTQTVTVRPAPAGGGNAGMNATGRRCGVQIGTQLWLGVELMNAGSGPLVVRRVRVSMDLGGLDETSLLLGACGQLEALDAAQDVGREPAATLDPSETTWVSAVFDVLESCPAPFPVQFLVDYTDPAGENYAIASSSFPDLGDVEYSGC